MDERERVEVLERGIVSSSDSDYAPPHSKQNLLCAGYSVRKMFLS